MIIVVAAILSLPGCQTSSSVGEGKGLYEKYCVNCHGEDGDLGLNDAGNLRESALNRSEVIQIISQGKGMMTAYQEILSPNQIEAIAVYVETMTENR